MAKRLLLLLGLLVMTIDASAIGRFKFGVRAGLLSRTVTMDSTRLNIAGTEYKLSTSDKYGFDAAASIRFRMWSSANELTGASLHLQADVVYAQNNMNITAVNMADETDKKTSKLTLRTIDVPVLVCLKASVVRLSAGPLFHAYTKYSTKSGDFSMETSSPLCGYTVGIGFDLGPVTVDGRYMGEFRKSDNIMSMGSGTGTSLRSKTSGWSIGVGVAF